MIRPLKKPLTVPNLVIARRVLDKMAAAARRYIADETGEAMVGLVVPGERTNGVPTIYVLDTISPDESAVREMHTFQQGDELQYEMFNWLHDNWRAYREYGQDSDGAAIAAKWDVPLRHVGDWHKQPGYMIQPSGGDLLTALDMLDDDENNFDFLLTPIVTLGHPATTTDDAHTANFITLPQDNGTMMRVDWWYIDPRGRVFQPIVPAVYPDEHLPRLPQYPWHLRDEARMQAEFDRMQADGLFTTVVVWDANNAPPLEICFLTARMGSSHILMICTPWNYPQQPPTARVAPFRSLGPDDDMFAVFEALWDESKPLADPDGWAWTPDNDLLDYVHALETALTPPAADADGDETIEQEQSS